MQVRLLYGLILFFSFSTLLQAQVDIRPTQMGINLGSDDPATEVSLHIKDGFEAIRLDGSSPFISFYDGTLYRGYLYMTSDNMYLFNRRPGNLFLGSGGSTRMTITGDGAVGVGTTTPDTGPRLQVSRGSFFGSNNFNSNTIAGFEKSSGNGYISVLTNSNSQSGVLFANDDNSAQGGIIYNAGGTADGLQFRTNGNITKMTIDAVGDVGIGIINANRPLHIKSRNGGDEYGIKLERSGSLDNWEMSVFRGRFNWFLNGNQFPVAAIDTDGAYLDLVPLTSPDPVKSLNAYQGEVLPKLKGLKIISAENSSQLNGKSAPTLGLTGPNAAEVFPELVRMIADRDGQTHYGIDYSKTGLLALKALQEMQVQKDDEKEELKAKVEALEAENAALQDRLAAVEDMIARMQESCCTNVQRVPLPAPDNTDREQPYLYQNEPNPFGAATKIRFFIPPTVQDARLRIVTMDGKLIKEVPVAEKGAGEVILETESLGPGTYVYSLIVDGTLFESKQMVLTR